MTLTQLRAFALVAELGSLRAAAAALGVSQPAVSAAMAALRADLGDPLFVRTSDGVALTAGGRALARHAAELVRLAERARHDVRPARSAPGLRVLASASCAEHLAPLLRTFGERDRTGPVDLTVGADDGAAGLAEDRYDISLGPWLPPLPGQPLDAVPFLRYRRVPVVGPRHPLAAARGRAAVPAPAGTRWLTGPDGAEPGTAEARWAAGPGAQLQVVRTSGEAEAVAEARAGQGMTLALAHLVDDDLRRGTLVRPPLDGTPVEGIWWATVPRTGRGPAPGRTLQRFLTTPEATAALLARPRRERRAPTARVELWS